MLSNISTTHHQGGDRVDRGPRGGANGELANESPLASSTTEPKCTGDSHSEERRYDEDQASVRWPLAIAAAAVARKKLPAHTIRGRRGGLRMRWDLEYWGRLSGAAVPGRVPSAGSLLCFVLNL